MSTYTKVTLESTKGSFSQDILVLWNGPYGPGGMDVGMKWTSDHDLQLVTRASDPTLQVEQVRDVMITVKYLGPRTTKDFY